MLEGMNSVILSPDLERFADKAVASGRYRDVADVIAAGVGLLQRREQARAALIKSLEDAQAEGERDGFFELDQVLAEVDAIIDDEARHQAGPGWRF